MQLQKEKQAVRKRTGPAMKARIITALIMMLVLAVLLMFRGIALYIALTLITLASQYELIKAFAAKGVPPYRIPVYFSGLLCCTGVYFFGTGAGVAVMLISIFIMVVSGLVTRENGMDKTIYSCFVVLYPALCSLCMIALNNSEGAFEFLLCGICAAIGSDTMGFFIGSAFGKTKLSPRLSPNKTVEGAVAGLFGGILVLALVRYLFGLVNIDASFVIFGKTFAWVVKDIAITWPMIFGCGVIGAAVSIVGDLFASSIKRYCGIKDFSTFLPGHGGVLDRLDGIFFSCGMMYLLYYVISFF